MVWLLVIHVITGLVLIALAWPMVLGRIPPNRWYGFRTPRTLEDPELWYPANAYTGKLVVWVGVSIILAAGGLYFVPGMDGPAYAIALTVILVTLVGGMVVLAFRHLRQLIKARDE